MSKLVTFEQAKKLKELGYNNPERYFYFDDEPNTPYFNNIPSNQNSIKCGTRRCSAPTVSEALDFIREEKGIGCGVYPVVKELKDQEKPIGVFYEYCFIDYKHFPKVKMNELYSHIAIFKTYPEAESALLNVVLEYLEKGTVK